MDSFLVLLQTFSLKLTRLIRTLRNSDTFCGPSCFRKKVNEVLETRQVVCLIFQQKSTLFLLVQLIFAFTCSLDKTHSQLYRFVVNAGLYHYGMIDVDQSKLNRSLITVLIFRKHVLITDNSILLKNS